jgi:hypothetical protein
MVLALLGHSSWQLSCLLLQLHFVPPFSSNASNRCPCFGSPANRPQIVAVAQANTQTKTATHCQSGSKLTFFLSGCGLNSQRRAEMLWTVGTPWKSEMPQKSSKKITGKKTGFKLKLMPRHPSALCQR